MMTVQLDVSHLDVINSLLHETIGHRNIHKTLLSVYCIFYRTYWISGQGKIVLPVPEELHIQRTLGKAAYGELTVLIVFDEIF